jgi:hypothetical protein
MIEYCRRLAHCSDMTPTELEHLVEGVIDDGEALPARVREWLSALLREDALAELRIVSARRHRTGRHPPPFAVGELSTIPVPGGGRLASLIIEPMMSLVSSLVHDSDAEGELARCVAGQAKGFVLDQLNRDLFHDPSRFDELEEIILDLLKHELALQREQALVNHRSRRSLSEMKKGSAVG